MGDRHSCPRSAPDGRQHLLGPRILTLGGPAHDRTKLRPGYLFPSSGVLARNWTVRLTSARSRSPSLAKRVTASWTSRSRSRNARHAVSCAAVCASVHGSPVGGPKAARSSVTRLWAAMTARCNSTSSSRVCAIPPILTSPFQLRLMAGCAGSFGAVSVGGHGEGPARWAGFSKVLRVAGDQRSVAQVAGRGRAARRWNAAVSSCLHGQVADIRKRRRRPPRVIRAATCRIR